ncbi:hypothetical protein [Actinacidiphila glaucinigra]|uniref:hypothetical protein n=1 Tax=Actinacidiphila glaucinigra TaxID=235986 RepID=UPI00371CDF9A
MTDKPKWQNHPAWYLLLIVPQLVFVTSEEDKISRFLDGLGLLLWGILCGRELTKRAAYRRATAGSAASADKRRQWRERGRDT